MNAREHRECREDLGGGAARKPGPDLFRRQSSRLPEQDDALAGQEPALKVDHARDVLALPCSRSGVLSGARAAALARRPCLLPRHSVLGDAARKASRSAAILPMLA